MELSLIKQNPRMDGEGKSNVIVLVDMDGTIANFEGELLRRYQQRYPTHPFIPLEKRTKCFAASSHYDELGYGHLVQDIMLEPGFFLSLPPIPGSCEALNALLSHPKVKDVFLCTSPLIEYENCVLEKYKWVENHLGKKWVNRLVMTRDKTLVTGDFLIDDKPKISGMLTPSWQHVLFSAPYNQHLTDRPRITSWAECQSVLFS